MTGIAVYEALRQIALNNPIPERCEVTTAIFIDDHVMNDVIHDYKEGKSYTEEIPCEHR